MSAQLSAYAERHAQTFVGALGRLSSQPIATLMIMSVIAIAIALPLCLQLVIQNTRAISGAWSDGLDLTIYLDTRATEERARAIAAQLQANPELAAVHLITAAEALQEFKAQSGFGAALEVLKDNPLPHVIVVSPTVAAGSVEGIDRLQKMIGALPDVANVQVDTAWVKRFHAILDLIHRLVSIAAAILAVGIVLVIGNTIRLDILNRRNEIEVMKLVGGTDGFARRPFLYNGLLVGLGGGLLALALVTLAAHLLAGPAERLAGLYGSAFRIAGLGWRWSLMTVAGSGLLGWLGAFIAATRHIRSIEPT